MRKRIAPKKPSAALFRVLSAGLLAGLLSACGQNKIIVDLPSPEGQYHVEVRKCPQPGSLSRAEQTQVSVLESGVSENCQSAVNALSQFTSYAPDDQLQLEWISAAVLRAWHPAFDPKFGPQSASSKANNPVKVIFAPAK